jgi:hypothetical protein
MGVCLGWLAGNVHWLRQCRWLSPRTRQPCRDDAQQLVDRDGFCISCICICISLIESAYPPLSTHSPKHVHLMTITPSCCAALHGKPLTHPHTHAPQPQTNPHHTPFCTSSGPRLSAHKRVFWTPRRAGNREGDFHSRGRRHHARTDRRAQRGVHPRRLRWGRAARLREAEKVYERFTRERLGRQGEAADTCTPTHARLRRLPGGLAGGPGIIQRRSREVVMAGVVLLGGKLVRVRSWYGMVWRVR